MPAWAQWPLWVAVTCLAAFAIYYRLRIARPPQLVYPQQGPMAGLAAACPSLQRPFAVTPWACNAHLQIGLLLAKEALDRGTSYDQRDTLAMADGGTTAIEWLGYHVAADTPTILLLPTITGCGQSIGPYARYLQRALGWRVAVCLRRGHSDLPLTAPQVNTLGSTSDLRAQISHIQRQFPHSPLFALGISAGSGLLVRYLGEEGEKTPIRAAFVYCPAYDTDVAFSRAHPFYSGIMARKLVRHFLEPHRDSFGHLAGYQACIEARDMHEFHQHCYAIAGFSDQREYSSRTNPMRVVGGITIPVLVLNARDDPICSGENVDENRHIIAALDNSLLVVTDRGSHCAHYSGLRGQPWAMGLMAEFFGAAARLPEEEAATAGLRTPQ